MQRFGIIVVADAQKVRYDNKSSFTAAFMSTSVGLPHGELLRRYYENCNYGLCEYSAGTKLMWGEHLLPAFTEAAGCLIVRNEAEKKVVFDYPVPGPEGDEDAALSAIEDWCMRRVYEMTDESGNVCVSAKSEWILVDPAERKILRPSSFTGKPLTTCPKSIDCPDCRRIALPQEGTEVLGTRLIRWSDLDGNGHVYSGNYGDIVWDFLPVDLQAAPLRELYMIEVWFRDSPNFLASRGLSLWVGTALVPVLFYTYTGITGIRAPWADVTVFIFSAATAFLLDLCLRQTGRFTSGWQQAAGLAALWALALVFVLWTYRPPHLPLFWDAAAGVYGVPS